MPFVESESAKQSDGRLGKVIYPVNEPLFKTKTMQFIGHTKAEREANKMSMARDKWLLVSVLIIGGILRFAGVSYGLPYVYRSDEPTMVDIALNILKTRDLNPHWFGYPSVMFYLNALVYAIYFLLWRAVGIFKTVADMQAPYFITMGVGRELTPNLLLLGRSLTALFGMGCVFLIYIIGKRVQNVWVGVLSAAILAVSPTAIGWSQNIAPDTFALFFILVSLLATLGIYQNADLRSYVLSGAAAGVAVSSKYNAVFILIPMLVAHFLRIARNADTQYRNLIIGIIAGIIGFVIATPFSVLDSQNFVRGLMLGPNQYIFEGHTGWEGNSLQWYVTYLLTREGLVVPIALSAILYVFYSRSRMGLVLSSFPIVYFGVISQLLIRNPQTVLFIIPFLGLLASSLLVNLRGAIRGFPAMRGASSVAVGCFILLVLALPLRASLDYDIRLIQPGSREVARVWLESNLPSGARIALESYSPFLDQHRFSVVGVGTMVDHSPEWYAENRFEYLVFSQGMYGRFFAEPERYQAWVDKYNEFFSRFEEVRRFDEGGAEIRVYRTGVSLSTGQ